jgi:DNA-binding protein
VIVIKGRAETISEAIDRAEAEAARLGAPIDIDSIVLHLSPDGRVEFSVAVNDGTKGAPA